MTPNVSSSETEAPTQPSDAFSRLGRGIAALPRLCGREISQWFLHRRLTVHTGADLRRMSGGVGHRWPGSIADFAVDLRRLLGSR